MLNIHDIIRRVRGWISTGVALPPGHRAGIRGVIEDGGWRDVAQNIAGNKGWVKQQRGKWRVLAEPERREEIAAAGCMQEGNPGGFGTGRVRVFPAACVYWLPKVIYHGLHGAITTVDGRVYGELLDGALPESASGSLDTARTRERVVYLPGRVMALSCSKNHYHWLLKMVPRLHLLERTEGSLQGIDTFLVNKPTPQQAEAYWDLGIWDRCRVLDSREYAACRMLAAPRLAHDVPAWACHYARAKFGPQAGAPGPGAPAMQPSAQAPSQPPMQPIMPPSARPAAASLGGPAGRRIYLSRAGAAQRTLVNEREIAALLEGYGFEIAHCGGLGIREQAALFADCEFIVAPHGAALANLVFCAPGTTVLELYGSPQNQKTYWLISHHLRLRYHYLMGEPAGGSADANMADFRIAPGLLARNIELLLSGGGAG